MNLVIGKRTTRSGYTMLELTIAISLLSLLIISVGTVADRASGAYEEGTARASLDTLAHRALDRLTDELSMAERDEIDPNPIDPTIPAQSLEFRIAEDYAGGAIVWDDTTRIAFEYETGEVDNGVDDNGNGLIDEGVIARYEDWGLPTERRLVICRWVREFAAGEVPNLADDNGNLIWDERGLNFFVQGGDVLTVRITLERPDQDGRLLTRTVQASVRIWN